MKMRWPLDAPKVGQILSKGFHPKFEVFYLHRPEGFLKKFPIFICTRIRHFVVFSGVLFILDCVIIENLYYFKWIRFT